MDKRDKRLTYTNGDNATFYEIWQNVVPRTSVFSPNNGNWFFNVSGLDSNDKLIFSSHWHNFPVLSDSIIPPFNKIKKFQISLATNLRSSVSDSVWNDLKYE